MAETTKKAKETEVEKEAVAPVITYSNQEFAISGVFSCPPECVIAAFRENGKTRATLDEAQKLVKAFLMKEIK